MESELNFMIIRIVKMTFRKDRINDFINLFAEVKSQIGSFEGVKKLELLQETEGGNVFFTYSFWESEENLNKYRKSDLFKGIWTQTKSMFAEKAEAWSTELVDQY